MEGTRFKLNDPDKRLPSPFPVFKSWTKFREDEYFDNPPILNMESAAELTTRPSVP